jgi:hypothetical protein
MHYVGSRSAAVARASCVRVTSPCERSSIARWGAVWNSVCGRRVEHQATMALVKRSPMIMAN